ncbi:MAG TPA: thioredoxin domain-containing protein [Polyangia bacterium]|nr:thioredoxin domain-containing protein [Polyangia bacterium]
MPNRLADETSPYLRQHADNPVDWHPWSEAALGLARSSDKPILLSIGYSACHWCHVMAHESFEDDETAALMNERFVCIKVDREEMPDVDQIYQQALQLQGEHGGWPLTMFLTPEGVPYFGGTYFPKREGFGRPSFKRLLTALSDAYRTQRDAVAENARQYREGLAFLATQGRKPGADEKILADSIDRAAAKLAMRIDRLEGGFQGAPKFPNPKAMELILRGAHRAQRAGDSDAAELVRAVTVTLLRMAEGGIYDHLGGGFARYSTDAHWLVPHFEKMLYDNGQLLTLYAEAYQVSGHATFARVMRETAAYLERDLRASDGSGGLYTAEDADSEGVEGKFYVWTPAELRALLGDETAALFARVYDVTDGGNWSDPHGHGPANANILHVVGAPESDREAALLDDARKKLLAARSKRVRPGLDDKVLASSNGLAIAGLAEAGRVLGDATMIAAARRTAEFVLAQLRDAGGRLLRTFKGGRARLPGTLDDHALVADGLIALYEATGEARWIEEAHALTRLAVELFYDDAQSAFFVTAANDPGLIQRPVSTYDSAVPSGMSVCVENLIRLGDVCGETRWLEIAERVLRAHYERAMENPFGFSNLLNALDLFLERPTEIVLAGADVAPLERALAGVYLPNRVIARADGAPKLLAPLTAGKIAVDGKAAAYVCRDFTCERPETDPAALAAALARR